jgi:hypothetical protein
MDRLEFSFGIVLIKLSVFEVDDKTVLTPKILVKTQKFLVKTQKRFSKISPELADLFSTCTKIFSTTTFQNFVEFFRILFLTKFSLVLAVNFVLVLRLFIEKNNL